MNAIRTGTVTGKSSTDNDIKIEIYKRYCDRLYSTVFYCVGQDRETAENIVAATFRSFWQTTLPGDAADIYASLLAIANQKMADYYRRPAAGRQDKSPAQSAKFKATKVPYCEKGFMLENLSWRHRQVLILKYVEKMSVAGISRLYDKDESYVKVLLRRARKAFQESLASGVGSESDRG